MRRSVVLVATLAVALPLGAAAQREGAPDAGGRSEVDSLPVLGDESPRDFAGAPDGEVIDPDLEDWGEFAGSRTHTVVEGDTLWDISRRYLNDPWYWPKVWSYNPQIENPHWIYPGDQIRLGPDSGRADLRPAPTAALPDLSRGSFGEAATSLDVSVAGRIGYVSKGSVPAPRVAFVSDREIEAAGVISRSWEEKTFLMEGDRIYIRWEDRSAVEVGGTYTIYRTEREVEHPEEGGTVGYLTRVLGTARVVEARPNAEYVTALVVRSVEEISRGDRIGPVATALIHRVDPVPNTADVEGFILATVEEGVGEIGQGHVVFLDKGKADGLVEGNTLRVIRAGDGLEDDGFTPYFDPELPAETIGTLLVVDVQERTAAALVLQSIRELRIGDRVEMRAAVN